MNIIWRKRWGSPYWFDDRIIMPVRDRETGHIYCQVIVYGMRPDDMLACNFAPIEHAVRRLGLDPERYQASMEDVA